MFDYSITFLRLHYQSIAEMDIMQTLSSFYVPYSSRPLLPSLYLPFAFFLTVVPFFIPNRPLAILSTYPILLVLTILRPNYTAGDPTSDYGAGTFLLGCSLWYLDFIILSPAEGADTRFVGDGKAAGKTAEETQSYFERLIWAVRLMVTPNRGIGWNWQVKGVPSDPDIDVSKWEYVRRRLVRGLITYIRSLTALYVLGIATTLQERSERSWAWTLCNAIIGWSGAVWAWNGINFVYSFAAAITVSTGICGQWEWPPLTGDLVDAWSVRQMWRYVHIALLDLCAVR
jgi:hypothetical protein